MYFSHLPLYSYHTNYSQFSLCRDPVFVNFSTCKNMSVTLISVLVSFFCSVEDMHIMTRTLSHPISTFPAEVERAVVCPCFGSPRDDQRVGLIGSSTIRLQDRMDGVWTLSTIPVGRESSGKSLNTSKHHLLFCETKKIESTSMSCFRI